MRARQDDPHALADYRTFQYVPGPQSIFKGIRKLPAAHYLVCDAQGVRLERYWSLPTTPDRGHSVDYYRERETLLRDRKALTYAP